MNVADAFAAAWVPEAASAGVELLPVALARAAAAVLPVAGAGLSVMEDPSLRLPLGASEDVAASAERWQFTLGEGPCFQAHASGSVVVATEAVLARTWPALHDQLRRHTPFRAVVALPLGTGPARFGAMDLYFREAAPVASFDLAAAQAVAASAAAALLQTAVGTAAGEAARAGEDGPSEPGWLDAPAARQRQRVWIALGMSNVALGVDTVDALALLRTRAYASDQTLDDLADDLVEGRLPVHALQEQSSG